MMATAPTPTLARMLAPSLDVATASFVLEPRSVMTATRSTTTTAPTSAARRAAATASAKAPSSAMTATRSTTTSLLEYLPLAGCSNGDRLLPHLLWPPALYCSGYGTYGQMGNSNNTSTNTSLQTVRTLTECDGYRARELPQLRRQVDDGLVLGYNRQGQLGDGSTTQPASSRRFRFAASRTPPRLTSRRLPQCRSRDGAVP